MSATSLPRGWASLRMDSVSSVRPRSAPWGVLLALAALLTMSAMSAWHSASIHAEVHPVSVSAAHVHDEQDPSDLDSAVHLAAHIVGQGLALPAAAVAPFYSAFGDTRWPSTRMAFKAGLDPASLLRPPQG